MKRRFRVKAAASGVVTIDVDARDAKSACTLAERELARIFTPLGASPGLVTFTVIPSGVEYLVGDEVKKR